MRETEDEIRFQTPSAPANVRAEKIFEALSFRSSGLRSVVIKDFVGTLDDSTLDLLARGAPNLEEFEISQTESSSFTERGIRQLVQSCRSIQQLIVREFSSGSGNATRWSPRLLSDIANNCPQLRRLGLVNLQPWFFGAFFSQPPEDDSPVVEAFRELFQRCSLLASVNLHRTVMRDADRNPSSRRGVFHALHAAVTSSAGDLRIELAKDELPVPLRIFCGECRR
jgi:hypothetical protein